MQNASYVGIELTSMPVTSVGGGPGVHPFRGRARLLPDGQSRTRMAYFADGGRRTPATVAVWVAVSVAASVSVSVAVSASASVSLTASVSLASVSASALASVAALVWA